MATWGVHLQLFNHEASAVHIPGFYPKDVAEQVTKEVLRDPSRQQVWMTASGILNTDLNRWVRKVSWLIDVRMTQCAGRGLESSDVRTLGVKPYNMVASSRDKAEVGDLHA